MVYPIKNLLNDIRNARSFDLMHRIRLYLEQHGNDYGDELPMIAEEWQIQYDRLFSPENCHDIRGLTIVLENGTKVNENQRAVGFCEDAKQAGMDLAEYLKLLYPDAKDFVVNIYIPTQAQAEMAAKIMGIERRTPRPEQESNVVSINPAAIEVNRLQEHIERIENQIAELQKQIATRPGVLDQISRLEATMNELNKVLQSQISQMNVARQAELTRTFDSNEYNFLLRELPKAGYTVSTAKVDKGRYQVTFYFLPEDQQKIEQFIEHIRKDAPKPVGTSTARPKPPGYNEILDILCQQFTRVTGLNCGLSRSGALGTLASQIAEYAQRIGADWQQFDIQSIDLFPSGDVSVQRVRQSKIYPRELAAEVFNSFVARREGAKRAAEIESEMEGGVCSDEIIANAIETFDVYSILQSEGIDVTPLKRSFNEAVDTLSTCGYYPNNLDSARDILAIQISHFGGDYDTYMMQAVEQAKRRLRGG